MSLLVSKAIGSHGRECVVLCVHFYFALSGTAYVNRALEPPTRSPTGKLKLTFSNLYILRFFVFSWECVFLEFVSDSDSGEGSVLC